MLANASIQNATVRGDWRRPRLPQSAFQRGGEAAMGERIYTVYMMASRRNGTLYIGVTNNLALRAQQHRTGVGSQFTTKYRVNMLVWYESYGDINEAIAREKQLKGWERKWKLALIEHFNRDWRDLYLELNS